jgi:hypothetical protein
LKKKGIMCKEAIISSWILLSMAVTTSVAQTIPERTAKITYVDANSRNTKLADGAVFNPVADPCGGDFLWRLRAFGNPAGAGTIYEAGGQYGDANNPEDCPRLVTTVSGLPKNKYKVYVYFWSDNSFWRIRANLTGTEAQLPLFYSRFDRPAGEELPPIGAPAATLAQASDFDVAPLLAEGGRELWQAYLGTTGPTTTFSIYIDDDPRHKKHNYRTWYDGIGCQAEPNAPKVSPSKSDTVTQPGTKKN